MHLSDFDYNLPKHLIAQAPLINRDEARLLTLDLKNDKINHRIFNQITDILQPNDTIVVNDSRVVNARFFGRKPTGGKIELLILEPHLAEPLITNDHLILECLIKGKVRPKLELELDIKSKQRNNIKARILERISGGRYKVEFTTNLPISQLLNEFGHLPLPPYIKDELSKPERYQTIYSKNNGSVAAPTAGLHFTPELMSALEKKGVSFAFITLHISYGTFTPVRIEDITQHRMDREYVILSPENAEIINKARADQNGRLVAVGTTSVRTLETIAMNNLSQDAPGQKLQPWEGWTKLFIHPGFKFKAGIDILITNFHLPKSTLLMLVSAFAGSKNIFKAYRAAINKNYRFYSFGDAMIIIK